MAGLTEMQASTYENRAKKPSDNVSDNIPMLFMLRKRNGVETINGGREIWEDARVAQNAYVQRIDPAEEITLGYNQTLTGFQYSPKIIVVPVMMNILEQAQNQGDAEFLDLFVQRNLTADDSLYNNMEMDLQGDGTGFSGKAFAGIKSYIVTSTSSGSYGGIARSTYSSIRNIAVDAPSTFTGATDSSNIESRLRYCKNLVVRNLDKPELLLAGNTYFDAACDAMSAKQRFVQDRELFEAGFDNIKIEGMTCVLANGRTFSGLTRIAVDRAYGINLKTIRLKMYRGYNFQPLPKRVSVNQLVDVALTVGIGQFTSSGTGLDFVMYDS